VFDPSNPAMAPGGRVQPPINGDPVNPGNQKSGSGSIEQNIRFGAAMVPDRIRK
jgi:hypothetical protein